MTDEEYVFRQTEKERKRIGYGARNKKNGSKSRYVSLPSDKLSKKEREAMNGECVSIKMNAPTDWATFRNWPVDIQAEYVRKLEREYRATSPLIAKMLGVSHDYFRQYRLENGFPSKRGGWRNPDMDAWNAFLTNENPVETPVAETKAEDTAEAETPVEDVLKPQEVIKAAVEEHGVPTITLDMACEEKHSKAQEIAALISALAGTGAKLTIELVL